MKIDSGAKELAKGILEAQGKSYEEWLNEQHGKVITENAKVLIASLNSSKKAREV